MKTPDTFNNERRFVFSNWTAEDFEGSWNGEKTLVKAGESKELSMALAYNFTKHLVDREMSRAGKSNLQGVEEERAPYEAKTMAEIGEGTDSPALATLKEKIRAEVLEAESKKEVVEKKAPKGKVAKEFEDIK